MPENTAGPAPTIEGRVEQLLQLLDVQQAAPLTYIGARQPGGKGRVFGGQVIAQGLMAALREVERDRLLHSMHCYFMRAGDERQEIRYEVHRDFDGGSFSTRRIVAIQSDRPILTMTASFHRLEAGFDHSEPMPNVPEPEALLSEGELIEAETDPETAALLSRFRLMRPIEIRPVERRSLINPSARPAISHCWVKLGAPIGNDMALHRAILAYASDMMLLSTCTLPHAVNWRTPGMMSASLDHAVWFHADARVDDWLLYAMDSPWAGHGRGFNRGRFFTRDGQLVASVAQEGLIRLRRPVNKD